MCCQSSKNPRWHLSVTSLIGLPVLSPCESSVPTLGQVRGFLILQIPLPLDQVAFPKWEEQECTLFSLY